MRFILRKITRHCLESRGKPAVPAPRRPELEAGLRDPARLKPTWRQSIGWFTCYSGGGADDAHAQRNSTPGMPFPDSICPVRISGLESWQTHWRGTATFKLKITRIRYQ
ncbi:hypothetical protein ACLOJK_036817 [Asimina triloba]